MKKNLKNKTLSFQIIAILTIVFILLLLSQLIVTSIVKSNFKKTIEKDIMKEIDTFDSSYIKQLTLYYNGYYVIELDENFKPKNSDIITMITLDSQTYPTILTDIVNVGDSISYSIENNFLLIINNGDYTGTIENIVYPANINHLTKTLSYLPEILDEDLTNSLKTTIVDSETIYYTFINGFLIVHAVAAQPTLFIYLNIFQATILVAFLIIIVVCGYFFNYFYVYPITEMTEVCNNFINNKFSHNALDYPNTSYKNLGEGINNIGNALKQSYQELNAKTIEVENYIKKSEEDYKFNKQLVANISHEIKTPLAIIQATICGIQDGIFEGEEAEQELNNIIFEIDKTNKMLQEIVGLYKMESDSFQLEFVEFNLDEMLKHKLQEFEKIALKYEQELSYIGVKNLKICADKTQIERIINNIILNAITYSPKNNKVTIETRKTSKYSVLEIINYGITIDNEELKRIFEPFYRLDKARNKSEDHGNGLGLYYVKQMLDKHNFDFGMENVINGVRFYIIFQNKN